ncbi:MAG: hypothetical protein AAFX79_09155 [Planctomycetota bacterium]
MRETDTEQWANTLRRMGRVCIASAALAGIAASGAHAQNSVGPQPQVQAPTAQPPRELPSILSFAADGSVQWVEGDPGYHAARLVRLNAADRELVDGLIAERDALLTKIAIAHADKVLGEMRERASGDDFAADEYARAFWASLGPLQQRGTFVSEPAVRRDIARAASTDLAKMVRDYNQARINERRTEMRREMDEEGAEYSPIELRSSTIQQAFRNRDSVADAARLLKVALGGEAKLAELRPGLAGAIAEQGYWSTMWSMTDDGLEVFVAEVTGMEVEYPSPDGYIIYSTGLVPQDGGFPMPDPHAELEQLRVNPEDGVVSLVERDAEGLAVRLDESAHVAAFELMREHDMISKPEAERLAEVVAQRQRTLDEQTLRLYELLLETAQVGRVETWPTHRAVLAPEWLGPATRYGAWLNDELPAPSTFHSDPAVREAIEWETLLELTRIANEYDAAHIFDARIELIKKVRTGELLDQGLSMPASIKRPWRLQVLIGHAKESYARQLRVGEPDFRDALASLTVEPEIAAKLEPVLAGDEPLTHDSFWAVAVELPASAHQQLIAARTGRAVPEPGFFEGRWPRRTVEQGQGESQDSRVRAGNGG